MLGSFVDDVIRGLGGNDTVNGFTGDNLVYGGSGNDDIYGGDGNDTLRDDSTGNSGSFEGSDTFGTLDPTKASGIKSSNDFTSTPVLGGAPLTLNDEIWGGDGNDLSLGRRW